MSLRFEPEREEEELRAYLGAEYNRARLESYEAELEREAEQIGDESTLYRVSQAYLYNLTVFAMSGTKLPYLQHLTDAVAPGSSLLDYGCGIGSDGLMLLEAGYRVAFADFDNPSTRYLRWRLARRGLDAPIYDLDHGPPPDRFSLAYAFDVIEHVDDPFAFLISMESLADLVLVNFLESDPEENILHRRLPISALLRHARWRSLRLYRRYHGRSHLVLYGHREDGWQQRLRSWVAFASGMAFRNVSSRG